MTSAEEIARGLTKAQRAMVVASEPGGWGSDDRACGIELSTGPLYATARALTRMGLGDHDGPGSLLPGLYFNNALGLAVRKILEQSHDQ